MASRGAAFLPLLYVALLLLNSATSFSLPGLTPVSFCVPEQEGPHCQSTIDLFVNRLDSTESFLPYEYSAFDFCSETAQKRPSENLGQVLFGERIEPSPYKFVFQKAEVCKPVCTKAYYYGNVADMALLDFLKTGMLLNYHHHWIVDNMPVTWCYVQDDGQKICTPGFPIGCYVTEAGQPKGACVAKPDFKKEDTLYVFNHVDITIHYHRVKNDRLGATRLVAAKMEPKSYKHNDPDAPDCSGGPMTLSSKYTGDVKIPYTYSVSFVEDESSSWASRWDYVLESRPHTNIHWFSIVNSLAFVLFLFGMVAMVVRRSLHKDIARYNQTDCEDFQEHFGWKLVHGDVFRYPRKGMLLSVFLGSGAQIFVMTFVTLIFACLGFLSPANRGALMTCAVVLWVLLGVLAGYVAARFYRSFGGEKWKTNVLLTALLCPGLVFANFFVMNMILWAEGSSAAIPFGALVSVLALWLCITVPLTFIGAFVGLKKAPIEHPVRTNLIPRQIPEQSPCTRPLTGIVIGGLLPFTCIFIQLFFILNSIWSHQMFYMFGFLFLVFAILAVICSQVTIILCYYHLCAEDYRWQWRSFLTSGFSAVYFLGYVVVYFFTKLQITGLASTIIYFGYAVIMALTFFLITGTIGFFACFWFVTSIYSAIKVD